MILDGSANMLAARLHTPEQLAEMESTIQDMEAAVDASYEEIQQGGLRLPRGGGSRQPQLVDPAVQRGGA